MYEINDTKREILFEKLKNQIEINPSLNRTLVSFQANKKEYFYRWFKYKEGFSKKLVQFFLSQYHPAPGHILDPFAGVGSTLFAAKELGWKATGIELLPVGVFAFESRIASESVNIECLKEEINKFLLTFKAGENNIPKRINHITITKGAFPDDSENNLNYFLNYCTGIKDLNVRKLFEFSAFSVLEEISYTRKDGQYLRWDYRANKSWGKVKFDKGKIYPFSEAITKKLADMYQDLKFGNDDDLFSQLDEEKGFTGIMPKLLQGSSLELMPKFENDIFDFIMTSPPYCNRYDYTRTYALELVYLGYNDEHVKKLRQEMLSCTVENKEKLNILKDIYKQSGKTESFDQIFSMYNTNDAMLEVNNTLVALNKKNLLNNSNVPRMVKNYFLEMAFIIYEMYRVLKPGGYSVMVNDNVRYGGQEIPVDLILSDFAVNFGFELEKIWTLPTGKGNSSQQMGDHGRSELRKCVYVWRKN
ncbi:MAG TPA: DNA methyltransferase [bacterium]|nr:DNA methyltransferase [bacterium]HPN45631.1 DNA methyltransferase [bacterium]